MHAALVWRALPIPRAPSRAATSCTAHAELSRTLPRYGVTSGEGEDEDEGEGEGEMDADAVRDGRGARWTTDAIIITDAPPPDAPPPVEQPLQKKRTTKKVIKPLFADSDLAASYDSVEKGAFEARVAEIASPPGRPSLPHQDAPPSMVTGRHRR